MDLRHFRSSLSLAMVAAVSAALVSGCAKRQTDEAEPTPTPGEMEASFATPTPETVAELSIPTPLPTPKANSYVVRKGDTLWDISGDPGVMGDNFRWPLLFKSNRDQIIDPDLIEPAQDLTWKPTYAPEELKDAVGKAKETPPYVPHSKPRKQLPLKY